MNWPDSVDLREVGADAAAYIAHMDRSLRSRVFTYGPKLARGLNDTLTPVRRHAKAVAREGSRLRRLRDQVGFGAYIERFTAARRLNRTILFHMGPTNSGKTYAALQHLTAAETGAFDCGAQDQYAPGVSKRGTVMFTRCTEPSWPSSSTIVSWRLGGSTSNFRPM